MVPNYFTTSLKKINQVHEHQTRQARYNFLPPISRLYQLSEKAFSYTGTIAWNKLSSELKRSKTIKICNNKTKSFEILY